LSWNDWLLKAYLPQYSGVRAVDSNALLLLVVCDAV
jgi:hypothetical protein